MKKFVEFKPGRFIPVDLIAGFDVNLDYNQKHAVAKIEVMTTRVKSVSQESSTFGGKDTYSYHNFEFYYSTKEEAEAVLAKLCGIED